MVKRPRKQFERIEYEPRSVKEMLIDMKDSSDWMLDMAYAALVFDSKEMAQEVKEEEKRIDTLLYQTRMAMLLSARTIEDAEQLSGILQVASSVELMCDAAHDIVQLQQKPIQTRPYLSFILTEADEKLASIRVEPGSSMAGHHVGKLGVETETGARIIAIKRSVKWLFDIESVTRMQPRDILIVRGVQDGIDELKLYASGKRKWGTYKVKKKGKSKAASLASCDLKEETDPTKALKGVQRADKLLLMMKDTSELMVDLAYASLLYNDKRFARDVFKLEDNVDKLMIKTERLAIQKIAPKAPETALNIIRLTESIEKISDAAMDIADVVLRDIEPHNILRQTILESDTLIASVGVVPNSFMAGMSLKDLRLASETGMWVVAVRNRKRWTIGPENDYVVCPGDKLFVRGPDDGLDKLRAAAKGRLRSF